MNTWSVSQKQAIDSRGRNVIVSAGAGSGKTSVLVERVVRCVVDEPATDLNRLLVVTFTEAAAAEMRKRIGENLQQLADDAVETGRTDGYRHLSRQISLLDQAQISTLHSFCMQVVRQNYLRLDIDPGFDILSEEDGLLLKTAVLERLMETKLEAIGHEERQHPFIDMLNMFGAGDPKGVFALVFRLDTFARSQAEPTAWLEAIATHYNGASSGSLTSLPWYETFRDWVLRQLLDALDGLKQSRDLAAGIDSLVAYVDSLNEVIPLADAAVAAVGSADWETVWQQLAAVSSAKSPRAKKSSGEEALEARKEQAKKLRKDALDGMKPLLEILSRGMDALVSDITAMAPAISELTSLVKDFQQAFMAEKRRRGQLDFNDLEHFAYEVLMDASTGEAQRLQEQYVEIFVDEFQDTSPIQDALVRAIARQQGNVFVVGDVKQSIYRFRMAEPRLFLDKYFARETLDHSKFMPLHLSENYRSRKEVVAAVNFIFGQLFSEAFGGAPYDEEAKMRFAARYPAEGHPLYLGGAVEVHLVERHGALGGEGEASDGTEAAGDVVPSADGDGYSDSDAEGGESSGEPVSRDDLLAIEREAKVITARIRELMGADGEPRRQVWDAKRQTYRPLQYRDIVVLLRSVKGRMTPLLDAFRAHDIPAYGVTSTGFYGALEIQWLLAALAAVDNPRREIELVATMRSPMGRFTDAELTDIRLLAKGNFYDAFRVATGNGKKVPAGESSTEDSAVSALSKPLVQKVRNFSQRINSWRRLSRRSSTEAVLMRILEDTGLLDYLAAMTGGRVRVANVQTLLERVRVFDRNSVDGLFGFVTHARELLQHEVDLGEARTLAEAEDVVRVMTIHQSKGLEFPVVFVADLGKQFYRNPLERALPLHRRMGFGPQRIDPVTDQRWRTMPSISIEEAETTEFLAEEARILYVALTRARERLILVGSARDLPKTVSQGLRASLLPEPVMPTRVLLRGKTSLEWLLPLLWRDEQSAEVFRQFLDESETPVGDELEMSGGASRLSEVAGTASFEVRLWLPETMAEEPDEQRKPDQSPSVRSDLIRAVHQGRHNEVINLLATAEADVVLGMDESHATDAEPKMVDAAQHQVSPPAKISATELRRLWTARHRTEQSAVFQTRGTAENLLEDPGFVRERKVTGRERGLAFHSVMQTIDFTVAPTEAAVKAEISRLQRSGSIPEATAAAVESEDVTRFLTSSLGQSVRTAFVTTGRVYREQPFFHRIDIGHSRTRQNFITVQGVMDCLLELDDRWILIDYKTDNIKEEDAVSTAEEYTAQISVYLEVARAVVGPEKPLEAFVYFVHPAVAIPLQAVDVASLFR